MSLQHFYFGMSGIRLWNVVDNGTKQQKHRQKGFSDEFNTAEVSLKIVPRYWDFSNDPKTNWKSSRWRGMKKASLDKSIVCFQRCHPG